MASDNIGTANGRPRDAELTRFSDFVELRGDAYVAVLAAGAAPAGRARCVARATGGPVTSGASRGRCLPRSASRRPRLHQGVARLGDVADAVRLLAGRRLAGGGRRGGALAEPDDAAAAHAAARLRVLPLLCGRPAGGLLVHADAGRAVRARRVRDRPGGRRGARRDARARRGRVRVRPRRVGAVGHAVGLYRVLRRHRARRGQHAVRRLARVEVHPPEDLLPEAARRARVGVEARLQPRHLGHALVGLRTHHRRHREVGRHRRGERRAIRPPPPRNSARNSRRAILGAHFSARNSRRAILRRRKPPPSASRRAASTSGGCATNRARSTTCTSRT